MRSPGSRKTQVRKNRKRGHLGLWDPGLKDPGDRGFDFREPGSGGAVNNLNPTNPSCPQKLFFYNQEIPTNSARSAFLSLRLTREI